VQVDVARCACRREPAAARGVKEWKGHLECSTPGLMLLLSEKNARYVREMRVERHQMIATSCGMVGEPGVVDGEWWADF